MINSNLSLNHPGFFINRGFPKNIHQGFSKTISFHQQPLTDIFTKINFTSKDSTVIGNVNVKEIATGNNKTLEIHDCGQEILKTFLAPLIRAYGNLESIPQKELENKTKYETFKIFDPYDKSRVLGFAQIAPDINFTYPSGEKGAIHLAVLDAIEGRKEYHGLGKQLLQFAIEKSHQEGFNGRIYLEAIRLPYDQESETPETFYRKFYFTLIPGSDFDEKLYYLPETYQQHPRCIDLKEKIKKTPILK